jgi:predicted nuclease of predicted toxin-antitoxin system
VRFLADESCDSAIIVALRAAGHDVLAVAEIARGADDEKVVALASQDQRILITEDKDFGQIVFAAAKGTSGVVLVRYPHNARSTLGNAIVELVATKGDALRGTFAVIEPGKVRITKPA